MEQVVPNSTSCGEDMPRDQDDEYYKGDEFRMSSMKVS